MVYVLVIRGNSRFKHISVLFSLHNTEFFCFLIIITITVFFSREREKNELKLKVDELEGYKAKYEDQKTENEVCRHVILISNICLKFSVFFVKYIFLPINTTYMIQNLVSSIQMIVRNTLYYIRMNRN